MLRKLIIGMILASVPLFAQTTTPQNPAPGTAPGSAQPMQGGMKNGQRAAKMRAMHEKQMQEMKQNIDKMKSLLQDMKTNAAGLSGKDKAAMDANVQLWQLMIDHMEQMMNHMSSMMQGQGMMHHHQGGMKGGANPPPPPPPQQ